jgi:hypothetical protein
MLKNAPANTELWKCFGFFARIDLYAPINKPLVDLKLPVGNSTWSAGACVDNRGDNGICSMGNSAEAFWRVARNWSEGWYSIENG